MGRELQEALGAKGGALVKSAKRLGVDRWWGQRNVSHTGPVIKRWCAGTGGLAGLQS